MKNEQLEEVLEGEVRGFLCTGRWEGKQFKSKSGMKRDKKRRVGDEYKW